MASVASPAPKATAPPREPVATSARTMGTTATTRHQPSGIRSRAEGERRDRGHRQLGGQEVRVDLVLAVPQHGATGATRGLDGDHEGEHRGREEQDIQGARDAGPVVQHVRSHHVEQE